MQRMASGCPEALMCTMHSESILELAAEAKEAAQVREESESDSESDSDVDSVTLSTLNRMNNLVEIMDEVMDGSLDPNEIDRPASVAAESLADWETEVLINLNTAAGTSSDAKSTARQYKRSNKVWVSFMESVSLTKHNLPSKDLYLPGVADDYVNRGLARLFLRYFITTQGASRTNYDLALNYLQRKLDDSLNKANKVAKRGAIKDDKQMKAYLKSMLISMADQSRTEGSDDLHAALSSQIPRSKELVLVDACYDPLVVPNLSALAKSNVVTGYTHSGQVGHRGNEGRALMMHHGFISEMQYLGDGETVDNFIHNYGKTNRVGRLETKTFCNHRNPRMDTSAHLGMNALLRFIVLCEPFPNFLDPDDYTNRPIFRSARSYTASYPPSTQNKNWNALFDAAGINAEKVTHQQRQQLQQKLADAGLDLMHLERFIGYATNGQKQMNGNQLHSYLFNSPVQAVAGAADGDPNNPATFKSGWDVTVSDADLVSLCPFLFDAIGEVEMSMAQYPDPKEQESRCLLQAHGSLLAIRFRIISAVKLLASLPLNDKNNLQPDELPIYQRWAHHPVVKLPFFGSQTFFDICTRVQNNQKQAAHLSDNEPSAQHKSWFGREVHQHIVPKLSHNIRLIQSLITGQRELRVEVLASNSRLQTVDHNMHSIDETNETVLSRLDVLTSQVATVSSQLNALLSHYSLPTVVDSIPTPPSPPLQQPPTPFAAMHHSPPPGSSVPVTPSPLPPHGNVTGLIHSTHSTYDPVFNTKGEPRKRAPPQHLWHRPFSDSNLTARDFWNEYKYGTNGLPSLESLELRYGTKWRSDRNFKRSDGQCGTTLKSTWSSRLPVYAYMEFLTQMQGHTEEAALELIEDVFRSNRRKTANKPNLSACKKDFVRLWGKVDLKKGLLIVEEPNEHPVPVLPLFPAI
jgi:hypothetical protein